MSSARNILRKVKNRVKTIILGHDLLDHVQKRCLTERHGSEYGGWTICPSNLNEESVIYSLGVGDDISFDISLIEKYGVNVYSFDPTPKCITWIRSQCLPKKLNFYEYGVLDYDGTAKFYPHDDPNWVSYTIWEKRHATEARAIIAPVRSLSSIMSEFDHRRIDILKMDIEGAEYTVIKDMVRCGIEVSQLVVEFHHRFKGIGIDRTKDAIKLLNKNGYKIFAISSGGEEYSFIRSRPAKRWFSLTIASRDALQKRKDDLNNGG